MSRPKIELFSVRKQEQSTKDKNSSDVSKETWSDWENKPAGRGQVMAAMIALCNCIDSCRNELAGARKKLEDEKTENQYNLDWEISKIRKQCEDECQQFTDECENNIKKTESRKNTVNTVVNACNDFSSQISETSVKYVIDAIRDKMNSIKSKEDDVIKAIDSKIQAYQTLRDCQIAKSERFRDDMINTIKDRYHNQDEEAEYRFKVKYKNIYDTFYKDMSECFDKDIVPIYQKAIESPRFSAVGYECPSKIPDCIILGNIGLILPNSSQDDKNIIQALELQAADFSTMKSDEYVLKIPYSRKLSDGLSFLMRYSPSEEDFVQRLIQPLLLNLFLSFPAGKLEATMIDPRNLGKSFPDIPRLAETPDSARIIDTKIWSKENDIENAIATLRQRLENINQAYGRDYASQLKKEAVHALAITDFPAGFTDTALKDLQAIVRNSVSLGVYVLICANDKELEDLKQRNESLVDEIAQSLVETRASRDRLMFVGTGSKQLFLQIDELEDVFEQKEKIFRLFNDEVDKGPIDPEPFSNMYEGNIYDSNNWFKGKHEEIAIPLGVKGAKTVVEMVLGRVGPNTEHHALITGQTGAGKSTLLHTLIMSTLISYSPDEVQMYLLDFKEGVEFNAYTRYRLPSLRVVAINSERDFGLSVLEELDGEFDNRAKVFVDYKVKDINDYMKLLDVPKIPKLLLIFDEVQELFRSSGRSDSISSKCLSIINKLVSQGRSMGIHVILASQDFHNCAGLGAYFSQMDVRVVLKGSENGAASILNANNGGIRALQNQLPGTAIYNNHGGVESANDYFRVGYISDEERVELLARLDAYFTDPKVAPLYKDCSTRVLLTDAKNDIYNCFNRLILENADNIGPLAASKDGYGLFLGQGFKKKDIFIPELRIRERDNLLIVTEDEEMALSLFEFSIMSILYEGLRTDVDKAEPLIYIADYLSDEIYDYKCDFNFLGSKFPQQIKVVKISNVEELITDLYETVTRRLENGTIFTKRIFLMFFGINRARKLRSGQTYKGMNLRKMLYEISIDGPKCGVNSIVWAENIQSIESMFYEFTASDKFYDFMFDKRIACGIDEKFMDDLVAENNAKALYGKTAVYMDVNNDSNDRYTKNTHFRPYEVPSKAWVEQYAEAYNAIINKRRSNL